MSAVPSYSIWLLQTGVMPRFPMSGLLYGAHNEGVLEVPLGFVAIAGGGRLAVVDTGFKANCGERERYGVEHGHEADELLRCVGLDSADVDTVLLTHAHWDHMGNLDAFSNATVFVQEREVVGWLDAFAATKRLGWLRFGVHGDDFRALLDCGLDGRLRLVRGEWPDVLPGIDLVPAFDTHTPGSQIVVVPSAKGQLVLPGDAVLCYGNIEGRDGSGTFVPIGQAIGSQRRSIEVLAQVLALAGGNSTNVIPVHDLEAYTRFPSRETIDGLRVADIATG